MATIKIGSVVIELQASELGEAVRQLAPYLGVQPAPSTSANAGRKGYSVNLFPEESGHREHRNSASPYLPPAKGELLEDSDPPRDLAKKALFFLFHRGQSGATSEEFASAIGISHPKGIGSKMSSTNTILKSMGFSDGDAYINARDERGLRLWKAGPRIEEALKKLES